MPFSLLLWFLPASKKSHYFHYSLPAKEKQHFNNLLRHVSFKGIGCKTKVCSLQFEQKSSEKKIPPQFSVLQFQDLITKLFALSVQIIP